CVFRRPSVSMGTFCVSLLLCFVGVLSAAKGSLERLCEEGKDWPNISILKVREGGDGSLDLWLNTTEQIKVCKCDPLTHKQEELFVGLLGNLHGRTNEMRISLTSRTFTVQNAERTDEGIYIITSLLKEDTILAVVGLTLYEPSSTDTPKTVSKTLGIKSYVETLEKQNGAERPGRSNIVTNPDKLQENHCMEIPQSTGAKECPIICTAKVEDGGMISLTVPIDRTKQIMVSKCNDPKDCIKIALCPVNESVHSLTNEGEMSFDKQNLTMWNRGERKEFYYKFEKHLERTCLAQVNVIPSGPTVPPSEILSSTAFTSTTPKSLPNSGISKPTDTPKIVSKDLVFGLSDGFLAVVVFCCFCCCCCCCICHCMTFMEKRRHNESSSSYDYSKLDGQVDR
ncbi:hypothetical protein lerEdw1_010532, partial [Lerista edwardsae]